MNTTSFATCAAAGFVTLIHVSAQTPVQSKMRDVVTHEQIVEAALKAREEAPPPPVFKPATGADPTVANKLGDLISRSDVICFRDRATLVPKRALLHVPKNISDRLAMKEGAQLGTWSDFLNANRAWIRTVAVSRAQAEGNDPMPEATLKSFEKEQRLVVATYQDGPISVLPLKVPEAAPAPGEPAATASKTSDAAQPINADQP
jgi:hypothetical protein